MFPVDLLHYREATTNFDFWFSKHLYNDFVIVVISFMYQI